MLSEAMWGRLAPLLPRQKPRTGRPSLDHRRFLEAVLWLARTGVPWRDLPPELMNWRTVWRRLHVTEAMTSVTAANGNRLHLAANSLIPRSAPRQACYRMGRSVTAS